MALAFRAAGALAAVDGTSSGVVGLPAGLANGDILVLQVLARGTASTVPTPSGYTSAATINITNGHRQSVFYKVVTNAGAEVGPTVTQTVSALIAARLTAWSGGDTTTALDVTVQTDTKSAQTTFAAPSITPVTPGAMVLWLFTTPDDCTLNAHTQGTVAYSSDTTTGNDGSLACVYELQTNAAATGTCSITQSVNGPDNWNTVTLALRPAAVAASNPSRDIGFDSITYALEMAFGSSAFTPSPTWTDVSAYVRADQGISVTRGRNSEFSDTQTGSMSFTLNNRDRRFDPDYSSGPYFGQLLPQTRVRLRVRQASVNYPIFDGFVRSFDQAYLYPREAVTQVIAFDLFVRLATRKLPPSILSVAMIGDTPNAYFPMAEEEGRICADLSGNGWTASYGASVGVPDSFMPGEPQFKAKRLETFSLAVGGDFAIFNAAGLTVENIRTFETWFQIGAVTNTEDNATLLTLVATATSNQLTIEVAGNQSGLGGIDSSGDDSAPMALQVSVADATVAVGTDLIAPVNTDTPHHVVVTLDSTYTTHSFYLNGQLVSTQDVSAGTFNGGSRTSSVTSSVGELAEVFMAHTATYEETLTAAQVLEHYELGLTGGRLQTATARMDLVAEFARLTTASLYDSTDLKPNTYLGRANFSGTVLSAMQSIMTTEQGRLFVDAAGVLQVQGRTADMKDLTVNATVQATLSDSGTYAYASPDGIHIQPGTTDLIRNVEYVTAGGGTVIVSDQESVTLFDEREESISTELDDQTAASNLGLSRLRRYADPTTRIDNVTVTPHGAADVRYALVFLVDLGWRLTVTRTPQAISTAISKTVTVEGITHTLTDANWITSLYLVPANTVYTAQPWFVLGDATYGRLGTAAGNQLSY